MSLFDDIQELFPDAKQMNGYVRIRCPYHKGGMEHKASMSILTEQKGSLPPLYAKCFTCGWTGQFEDIAKDFGMQYVPDTYTLALSQEAKQKPVLALANLQRAVYKKDVPYHFSPYLASRGIPEAIQKQFKVFEREDEGKVYLPVFSGQSQFLYANARSTKKKMFFIETGIRKSLAYIEELDFSKPIAIVESQINALSLYTVGIQAVALLGATNSQAVTILSRSASTFILALDPDEAGNRAKDEIATILGKHRCVYLNLPAGKDVNDLWQDFKFQADAFKDYLRTTITEFQ